MEEEDFLTDVIPGPRKRRRPNPHTDKTVEPLPSEKGQQKVRNIRPELQTPLPIHLTHIPRSSHQEFGASATAEIDLAQEDYAYHDTTLPPLPGEVDGEEIADGTPPGYTDGIPGVESPPHSLDDPWGYASSGMASRMNSCSLPEAEAEPGLNDGSNLYSWRTPTPDAPKRGLGVSA
ncbi:hypothetical protein FRC06_009661 [Ceratobasidium sp. 370]|nr:hypothetical protein FRC06_009661 [Ceratobasidium sp. 370]